MRRKPITGKKMLMANILSPERLFCSYFSILPLIAL